MPKKRKSIVEQGILKTYEIPVVFTVQAVDVESATNMVDLALKETHKDFGKYLMGKVEKLWRYYDKLMERNAKKA